MGNSLQDQLLKAGVVDKKQAKKAKVAKHQAQSKKGKKGEQAPQVNEAALAAQKAMQEKVERDRQLNQQRKAEAEQRALAAQVRQLIEQNRVDRNENGEPYHFQDGKTLRSLPVTAAQRDLLARGKLDIVREGETYELVPAKVGDKIRERIPERVMARPKVEEKPDEDDPYAGYEVPDDLMW